MEFRENLRNILIATTLATSLGGCALAEEKVDTGGLVTCEEYGDFMRTPGRTQDEVILFAESTDYKCVEDGQVFSFSQIG